MRDQLRARLLPALLTHVSFTGWSRQSLHAAADDIGLSAIDAERAFPRVPEDLLHAFESWADQGMIEKLDRMALEDMRIRARIHSGVMARLDVLADHRDAVRRALALYALPGHAGAGLRAGATTVDKIWRAAGDRSTDFNYYTKRMLLAGVYASTLLYWLNDHSENQSATAGFLERRIGDVMKIQTTRHIIDQRLDGLAPAFRAMFKRFAA